jgi:dTDP-4-dehydrorhamnose 3,5-epimerase
MTNDSAIAPPPQDAIIGVECKLLKSYGDDRGFFREIIRYTDPFFTARDRFAQWSHSRMTQNVVKAWHYHHVQTDWWYVPIGQVETVLFDNRPESPTYRKKLVFRMGESNRFGADTFEVCVHIPPGVLHGCKVLSSEAHLFYITSEIYDPNEEGRFPFDSSIVGHQWGDNVIVAENDKRTFEPIRPRISLSTGNQS